MVRYSKSMYWKNLRRSIFKSKARFFSIFFIVLLGAAFFSGLRNTPGTMSETMDSYLDHHHFSDLTYMASLGFDQEDIESIRHIEGIEEIDYGYQFDALMTRKDELSGVTVYGHQEYHSNMLNAPQLLDGRFPKSSDECVIDNEIAKTGVDIGENIHLSNDQGKKDFRVVGIVDDVRYIAKTDRGTNSLGDGTNLGFVEILNADNAFLAMPQELYKLRKSDILYNQLRIKVEGSSQFNTFTDEYDEHVETVNTKIKSELSLRMSDLYDSLTKDAKDSLDKAQKEYDQGMSSYQKSQDAFDQKMLEAKIQLTQAKMKLNEKEAELLKGEDQASQEIKTMVDTLTSTTNELKSDMLELQKELDEYKKQPSLQLPESVDDMLLQIQTIEKTLKSATQSLDGLDTLAQARLQLENAKLSIQQQENQLTLQEMKTQDQLQNAKDQLDQAKEQLNSAYQKMDEIPKGKLYTLTRHENAGLVNYESNIESITSIANIFPLIFFLVSALVSLTTMTRMVEEQRGQNGTLRALGYSKWDIMKQYVVYVLFATLFACVFGMIIGNQFFPRIIYYLYSLMLFQVNADIVISSTFMIGFETIFISVFVTLIVTLIVCVNELNLMPAVLMRPKAPKIGKRIFLERVTFLWKRLSFNQKVTMRNIFRYKKRFFMSVVGIAGCTALILTGFGIKNSVSKVVDKQYQEVFRYDALARLDHNVLVSDAKKYQEQLLKRDEVNNVEYVYNQSIEILKNKQDLYGNLVVYQSMDNISNFIQFQNFYTHKKIVLNDEGIVLSAKTAELLGVTENDTIDIDLNGEKYNVKISQIMENYFMNYVYMSQNLYEELTGRNLEVNNAYIVMKDDTSSSRSSLENYMDEKGYGHLSYIASAGEEFDQQVQSIDMVVIILIVCAGALNFIVLYNLTNINIQERKSEIATIKVLGFRRKEVYDYIFRENIILSIIGSMVGLILGYVLHMFIIKTVELDMTMFVRSLNAMSYVYAVCFTLLFTIMINFFMRHVLNRVDMVESLKSVE